MGIHKRGAPCRRVRDLKSAWTMRALNDLKQHTDKEYTAYPPDQRPNAHQPSKCPTEGVERQQKASQPKKHATNTHGMMMFYAQNVLIYCLYWTCPLRKRAAGRRGRRLQPGHKISALLAEYHAWTRNHPPGHSTASHVLLAGNHIGEVTKHSHLTGMSTPMEGEKARPGFTSCLNISTSNTR